MEVELKALIRFGDYAGMTASALCLAHCLATPLLLAAFPMLGLAHGHEGVHDALLAAISLPVLLALLPGYLKHRDTRVLAAGIAGLGCFLAAVFVIGPRFGELAEAAFAVASGALLLYAHLRNRRFRACRAAGAASCPRTRAAAATRE